MAGVPRMGGQRQAVSTCANDGNLIIAGIHLFFHCGKGIKPGIIPGFLPGKALHCRDDGQGGQFRQSVYPAGGVGEQLPALLVLGADGIRKGVEKNYIWQGEYGKRSHLKVSFKELLKEQDSSSLEMLAIFVNNNPYNFEFYIAVVYDIPKEEHVEKMIGLFENAGLVLRNDLTFFMFMNSMKDRRFNSCAFLGEQDIDLKFENMFDFVEIEDLKKKGYYMQPFGTDKLWLLYLEKKNRSLSAILRRIKRMWK